MSAFEHAPPRGGGVTGNHRRSTRLLYGCSKAALAATLQGGEAAMPRHDFDWQGTMQKIPLIVMPKYKQLYAKITRCPAVMNHTLTLRTMAWACPRAAAPSSAIFVELCS